MNSKRPADLQTNGAECESTPPRFYLSLELTARQREVLCLAAHGFLDREIGDELGLKSQTIRHTLTAARHKLRARNTVHAVAIALSAGIIQLDGRRNRSVS